MIDDLDTERVLEELQQEGYGEHPIDADELEEIMREGVSGEYEGTGELLTDISNAVQRIKARDTRRRATDLVEKYCSELSLPDDASTFGGKILDYLNEETCSNHEADAVAGASTYLSSRFLNKKVTREAVKEVGEIEDARFRNAYEDIRSQVTEDGTRLTSDFPI